ncbi:FtsK/SpoIIIE domain-containing protein [Salinibacterium sp. M195]|uniref:FtsK/SpoIIIE domain-containing protein n=1 Tax=Salinibacterium sp. M195 TaxID=2583374 RepID=UPI001C62FB1F|nr:FtsK/SpoIIIE domain-containing protein [Salinibacterium sp. M195]QYH35708.1 FHA domain-containing protein [Salinibacterium sp. M195]
MKLKLTLKRENGPQSDIVVTSDASATVGSLAEAIATVDPFASKATAVRSLTLLSSQGGAGRVLEPDVALGDSPIASGATVKLSADSGSLPPAAGTQPAATLTIVDGPDIGRIITLPIGGAVLGRDARADILLDDPLVSKLHARVDVAPGVVRIVDLNSANGIEVDGGPVTRVELGDGETVLVGNSLIRVGIVVQEDRTHDFLAEGPIGFNRSPRVEERYPGEEFVGPKVPAPAEPTPFPWLSLIAPLLMGLVLFAVTQRLISVVFVALSPLLMLSTFFTNSRLRKRKAKLELEQFEKQLTYLSEELESQHPIEKSVRLRELPSTSEVYDEAMTLGPVLWTRRPEHWSFLSLRLGVGSLPSRNSVSVVGEDEGVPELRDRFREVRDRYSTVDGVPLAENLYESGALGIVGEHHSAADVARGLVTQAVGLHSPTELVVTAIVGPTWSPEFEWLKWLPHTAAPNSPISGSHLANSQATGGALLSMLEELVEARRGANRAGAGFRGATNFDSSAIVQGERVGQDDQSAPPPVAQPAILVLIGHDAPIDKARLVQLAENGAEAGVFPIWLAPEVSDLPAAARTYIETNGDHSQSAVGYVRLGRRISPVTTEPVSSENSLKLARRLAPVYDAGFSEADESDIPRSVSLVSLLGTDLTESSEAAIERWQQNDSIHDRSGAPPKRSRRTGRLRAIVGQASVDAMHLDLRAQGPHALVGGTTGSGKSEFLQAWVLGMAAEYSPDRVTFLFIDYKGGSAFADCVSLPHCVGLVTDLSPHLVRRALTSLRAELHYREHLLNRKKAKDLLELEKRGDPESPPALVLVIDEFAALVGEVPEFVDGVVDIAQRGRSLGIHLIMATQRPAGVIKDNLRANTNLRIALRMADETDSQDVVGDKIAGTFDPSIPGRGIAKTGPGRLTLFQSAYAGGWSRAEKPVPSIEVGELRFGAELLWEKPGGAVEPTSDDEQGPTDQARIVANLISAATAAHIPAARRPWLDQLAPRYDLTRLRQRTDAELVLGVNDVPTRQLQNEVFFKPDIDGNIVVYGSGGTGKSTMLRSLAVAAGVTPRGGPVDVYGLDFGTGALRMLEPLPHVGSIVSGDDPERVIRLLRTLRGIVEERGDRYTAVNASTIAEYRTIANRPAEARILLLVDNFPAFRAEFEVGASRAPWYAAFMQLLTEGRGLGVHVALSADRPGSVPSAVSAAITRRVVLRQAEESSYFLLDTPTDVLSAASPPGRAIIDGLETQLAVVGGTANVAEQSAAIEKLARAISRTDRTPAPAVGTLPLEYPSSQLPAMIGDQAALGISEVDLQPTGFEPSGMFVLAGPPASGRSNALSVLITAVERAVPNVTRYYIGNPRSALSQTSGWEATATRLEDVSDLAKEITATVEEGHEGRILVVIEQIADFLSSSADAALVAMLKAIKRSDHMVIAEADSSQWGSSWPLMSEVKSARTGFLLQPETLDGDSILKTGLPRVSRAEFPPGRGYFIARGKAVRVQLPLFDERLSS